MADIHEASQGEMFRHGWHWGGEHPIDLDAPDSVPVDFDVPPGQILGPHVELAKYRSHIVDACIKLGILSQRDGFKEAITGPNAHYVRMKVRESDDLVPLDEKKTRAQIELEAKQHFAASYGLQAVVGAIGKEAAKAMIRADYADFVERFSTSENRGARDEFRSRAEKNAKRISR